MGTSHRGFHSHPTQRSRVLLGSLGPSRAPVPHPHRCSVVSIHPLPTPSQPVPSLPQKDPPHPHHEVGDGVPTPRFYWNFEGRESKQKTEALSTASGWPWAHPLGPLTSLDHPSWCCGHDSTCPQVRDLTLATAPTSFPPAPSCSSI